MNSPRTLLSAVEGYWLAVVDGSTQVLVRTFYGFVAFTWAVTLIPDVGAIFGPDRIAPDLPDSGTPFLSVFRYVSAETFAVPCILLMLVSSALTMAGWRVRVTVPATALLFVSFIDASLPWAIGAEAVLVLLSVEIGLFALLTPTRLQGHHRDEDGSHGRVPIWGLRLLQLQIALGYVTTFVEKLRGTDWIDGSAVFHAMASETLQRFDPPAWIIDHELVIMLLTWGTLAVEGLLAVLLLWPRTRRYGVLLAIGLHVGIEVFLRLGFFAPAMAIGALAFLPAADAQRLLGALSKPGQLVVRYRRSDSWSFVARR